MKRACRNKMNTPFMERIVYFFIVFAVLSCKERVAPVIRQGKGTRRRVPVPD